MNLLGIEWFLLAEASILALALSVLRRHVWAATYFALVGSSAAWFALSPGSLYAALPSPAMFRASFVILQGALYALLPPAAAFALCQKFGERVVLKSLGALGLLQIVTIVHGIATYGRSAGLVGNAALDGWIAVLFLPLATQFVPKIAPAVWAITAPIALLNGSSAALAAYPLCAFAYAFRTANRMTRNFLIAIIPGGIAAAYLLGDGALGMEFLNANGRTELWGYVWKYMQTSGRWVFGNGIGSYEFVAPFIQNHFGFFKGHYFVWLHSDWFQILFELGALGLIFAVAYALRLVVLAWRHSPAMFATVITFGAVMTIQMPLRIALPSALIAGVIATLESQKY